ncbi:MAG: hypothetical protein RL338_1334 [Chloroflexota bacterium]|jgi:flavin reductase (DIM6/NTAB) family NADH-FMN oxidoreductase RutF
MAIELDLYRRVMGHFATGVTILTTLDGDRPAGVTVNAITSVSLEPPLLVVALDRRRAILPPLRATGAFAVNILGEGQQPLSDCFAGAPVVPGRETFCGAAWRPGDRGLPLIDGAIATMTCAVERIDPVGDHELVVARVETGSNEASHPLPLLYYRRRYLRIERAAVVELEGKPDG